MSDRQCECEWSAVDLMRFSVQILVTLMIFLVHFEVKKIFEKLFSIPKVLRVCWCL